MKSFIIMLAMLATTAMASTSKVSFVKPQDGEVVPQTFEVEFAVEGMTVEKAGVLKKGTGHHHLIINGKPVAKGKVVPKNDSHIHYGDGSTKTTVTLKPGKYKLTMQFADGQHKSYGKEMSSTITVEVK